MRTYNHGLKKKNLKNLNVLLIENLVFAFNYNYLRDILFYSFYYINLTSIKIKRKR